MKKRTLLALLLSLVMIASLVTPALAADDLGEPRVLGEETVVPVIDSEEISPLIIPYTGYFTGSVPEMEGRSYKLYIPEGYRMKTYQIVMNVPDGIATDEFLVSSGWKALDSQN